MKSSLFLTLFLISTLTLIGQDWKTDFAQAKEQAAQEHKKLILVFQGSDWCAPCIKMDKQIWSQPDFIEYAHDNYVMFKADFPKRKKNALPKEQQEQNNKLAEQYNKNGYFPYVVVLDDTGKFLGSTSYEKVSPKKYISKLNSL